MDERDGAYVGFWPRAGAAIIDSILAMLVIMPLLLAVRDGFSAAYLIDRIPPELMAQVRAVYGESFVNYLMHNAVRGSSGVAAGGILTSSISLLVQLVLPAIAIILFWIHRQATPGKMAIAARVVDASSGGEASSAQLIGRYFGYYISIIPLGLGLIWVGIDSRKQGWHDKLAGTVVVRGRCGAAVPRRFRVELRPPSPGCSNPTQPPDRGARHDERVAPDQRRYRRYASRFSSNRLQVVAARPRSVMSMRSPVW